SRLELHGIDTHHATSLASGDSSIHPARRRSCDRRLMVRANQVAPCLLRATARWISGSLKSSRHRPARDVHGQAAALPSSNRIARDIDAFAAILRFSSAHTAHVSELDHSSVPIVGCARCVIHLSASVKRRKIVLPLARFDPPTTH
ncbi:hypothetical protein, partial [Xanthomonas hortorum]|uniref:hypothetical protein n=1 Tax=Xanthomonas hortorum TaxID=56454 RepID=UPI001F327D98